MPTTIEGWFIGNPLDTDIPKGLKRVKPRVLQRW